MYATMVVHITPFDHKTSLIVKFGYIKDFDVKYDSNIANTKFQLSFEKGSVISEHALPVVGTFKESKLAAAYVRLFNAETIVFTTFKVIVTKPNIHWNRFTTITRRGIPDGNYLQ